MKAARRRGAGDGSGIAVCLEVGKQRVFASALDWPGWARPGRTVDEALVTLDAYRERYTAALALSGLDGPGTAVLAVVDQVPGNATTDFGAPAMPAAPELEPLGPAATARLLARLGATWAAFDRVVATAPPELRKGPRGGGRDTAGVVTHFYAAEKAYAHKVGFRQPLPDPGDPAAVADWRHGLSAAVAVAVRAQPGATGWPGRYAARRIAWHALDHTWEIEDKSTPG